jgi:hypothetical protein
LRDENVTNNKGQEIYDLWNENGKCPPEEMWTGSMQFEATVVPDIKVDGEDGPINVSPTQVVDVTIHLDPGDLAGVEHDWWIVIEKAGGGTFSWVWPGNLVPGIHRTYAGGLFPVNSFTIHNGRIPAGEWTISFAIDELNNIYEGTYLDSILIISN